MPKGGRFKVEMGPLRMEQTGLSRRTSTTIATTLAVAGIGVMTALTVGTLQWMRAKYLERQERGKRQENAPRLPAPDGPSSPPQPFVDRKGAARVSTVSPPVRAPANGDRPIAASQPSAPRVGLPPSSKAHPSRPPLVDAMPVTADEFAGIEDAIGRHLPRHLPNGVELKSVRLAAQELRIEAKARVLFTSKSVVLSARVHRSLGALRLDGFGVQGVLGIGEAAVRKKIEQIDEAWPPFIAKGERGGDALLVTRRQTT